MSVYVSAEVWKHSRQAGHRLLFLLALADYCNDEGICWPSQRSLAERLRCTERGVQKMTQAMVAQGELVIIEPAHGRGNFARYSLPNYVPKGERRSGKQKGERQDERANAVPRKGEREGIPLIEEPSREPSREPKKPTTLFALLSETLPPPINTPDCQDAWDNWQEHYRQRMGAQMTERAAQQLVSDLKEMGPDRMKAAIRHSIRNNWKGVHEEKDDRNGQRPTKGKVDYETLTEENAV